MAITKPTELPRFAELDQASPVSTNNVIEPPESYKKYGHGFREKYKRNFFNWIHRLTYEWLLWLDKSEASGILAMELRTSTGTWSSPTGCILSGDSKGLLFDMKWCRSNNIITLMFLPDGGTPLALVEISGILSTPQTTLQLEREGIDDDWPVAFYREYASVEPLAIQNDSKTVMTGLYVPPVTVGAPDTNITLTIPQMPSTQGDENDFYIGGSGVYGNRCGLWAQAVSFMVDDT